MAGEPDYLKHFDGVTRIPHMEGSWVFTEIGNGRVHIVYEMFSNQASKFPRWITDPIIQSNMVEMMSAFRSKVHEEITKNLAHNEIH
jgi:hypothetical protein